MAYFTESELLGMMTADHIRQALDDDGDGLADDGMFDRMEADASASVDAYLAAVYAVPFATPPAKVKEAAKVFFCEACYRKRGVADEQNPFSTRANALRKELEAFGRPDGPPLPGATPETTPGSGVARRPAAITEPARTYSKSGRLPL